MKKKRLRSIVIDVTQEDINNGIHGDETRCPIAQAVMRMYDTYDVHIGMHHISINLEPYGRAYSDGTEAMRRYIAAYDHYRITRPKRFRLPLDTEIMASWLV